MKKYQLVLISVSVGKEQRKEFFKRNNTNNTKQFRTIGNCNELNFVESKDMLQ